MFLSTYIVASKFRPDYHPNITICPLYQLLHFSILRLHNLLEFILDQDFNSHVSYALTLPMLDFDATMSAKAL